MRIAVLGAGAWGTALAIAFAKRHEVVLWARNPDHVEAMAVQRENTRYLKDCPFPDALMLRADYATAVADAELLVIAAPLSGLRDSLVQLRDTGLKTPFLWVCKGLKPTPVYYRIKSSRRFWAIKSPVAYSPVLALHKSLRKGCQP